MIGYGNNKCKAFAYLNGYVKLKKGYVYEDGAYKKIYSAGNIVTYAVDSGVSYQEEVDEGASCLSPKTFTPTKSGWTFAGWREDKTANGSVLTNKVMGDAPVTLYAVFKQKATLTLYNNSATPEKLTGNRFYNNGNVNNPSLYMNIHEKAGWGAKGWSDSSSPAGTIKYKDQQYCVMDKDYTYYAIYQKSVTFRYDGGGATGGSTATQSGTVLWNSSGQKQGATITLSGCGYSRNDHSFRGWSYGSQVLQPGAKVTIVDSTYATATWLQTVYRYNNAGNYAQVLTCPISANYRMEVWGAQGAGGKNGGSGGYGGYAVGTQYLPAGTILYIVVGGAGYGSTGGYNGGGNGGGNEANGGGGGATHIGLKNLTLAGYGNTEGLYIVAGGGGGGGSTHLNETTSKGGSGGGANGETGFNYKGEQRPDAGSGEGGTQTKGGNYGGSFGQGGHAYNIYSGGGGGGGLYGGGAGANYNGGAGGGGGSGYIGGVTNGSMAHWQNNGAGRAVITIL